MSWLFCFSPHVQDYRNAEFNQVRCWEYFIYFLSIEFNRIHFICYSPPAICVIAYFLNSSSRDDFFHVLPLYRAIHTFQSLTFYQWEKNLLISRHRGRLMTESSAGHCIFLTPIRDYISCFPLQQESTAKQCWWDPSSLEKKKKQPRANHNHLQDTAITKSWISMLSRKKMQVIY